MAKYVQLKRKLFEVQLGRCAACACKFPKKNFEDDPRRMSLVNIDRKLPVSYENCILMCGLCSGYSANYPSLEEFYESYIVQKNGKKEKIQNFYPETIERINAVSYTHLTLPTNREV